MSGLISMCCGSLVSPMQGDPCCCECGRENVITETIAERDDRMRVEGATWALEAWIHGPSHPFFGVVDVGEFAARIVAEHKEGKR